VLLDPEKLSVKSTVAGGAKDFWYFFAWDGFRPRAQGIDQPVTFPGEPVYDSLSASSTPPAASSTAPNADSVPPVAQPASAGFTVSFAALLAEDKAQQLANTIIVGGTTAHVVTSTTAGSPIYRVVLGPYATRDEAIKVARASKREYWVYEGSP
jgi:cell division septation protein DedD